MSNITFDVVEDGSKSIPVDLRRDGLLWLINTTVFHPRGYALGYDVDTGVFLLMGDGGDVWGFEHNFVNEEKFLGKVNAIFARASRKNSTHEEDS